jgi:hypothetical protein
VPRRRLSCGICRRKALQPRDLGPAATAGAQGVRTCTPPKLIVPQDDFELFRSRRIISSTSAILWSGVQD